MRVVTRHAAELVIALDKALALRQTIRLKTVCCLLGQLVKLCNSLRCAMAFSAGVIDHLAALVRELVQQQPTGFVTGLHRLCMRSTRPMTGLTSNTEKARLRNQAGIRTRHRVATDTANRIIHAVRLPNRLVGKIFLPWRYPKALLTWEPGLANLNATARMNREKCHPCLATAEHQVNRNRNRLARVLVRRFDDELALVIHHLATIWDLALRWRERTKDIRKALVKRFHVPRAVMLFELTRVTRLAGIVANIAIRCRCGSQLFLTPRAGWRIVLVDARCTSGNGKHDGRQKQTNSSAYPGHHFRRVYRRNVIDRVWMKPA